MHDNDLDPDQLRTHFLIRSRATLGRHTWSDSFRSAIIKLAEHFDAETFAYLVDHERVSIDRFDAMEGASAQLTIPRCYSPEDWKPNKHGHQNQRLVLDNRRSSAFVEGVLILMRMHFPDRVSVASSQDFADWQNPLYAVMEAVYGGPWVGQQVLGPKARNDHQA